MESRKALLLFGVVLLALQVLAAPLHGRLTRSRLPEYEITDDGIYEVFGSGSALNAADEAVVLLSVQEAVLEQGHDPVAALINQETGSPAAPAAADAASLIRTAATARAAPKKKKTTKHRQHQKKEKKKAKVTKHAASAFNCSCTFIPLTVATAPPSPAKHLAEQRDLDLIAQIKRAADARTHTRHAKALDKQLRKAQKDNAWNGVQGSKPTHVPALPYYPGAPYGQEVAKRIHDYRESLKPKKIQDSFVESASQASTSSPSSSVEPMREEQSFGSSQISSSEAGAGSEAGNIEGGGGQNSSPIMDGN